MNFDHEIDNTLARYFGGNASPEDMLSIEEWVSLSSTNQNYFDELTQIYALSSGINLQAFVPNVARAKQTFSEYINSEKLIVKKSVPLYKNWMFQAASIAIIVAISAFYYLTFRSNEEIILSSGTNNELVKTLPDNTQVKLFKNSEIAYRSDFGKSTKDIQLVEGSVSVDVKEHDALKLRVIAGETIIEDIGTIFSVSNYSDSRYIEVMVSSGEVHFFTKADNGLTLKAGEKGIYNKETKLFKVSADNTNKVANAKGNSNAGSVIKVGEMYQVKFDNIALGDAVKSLNKQFNVQIKFKDKDIASKRITVNFEGENADMALQIIAQTLDLRVTKKNDTYFFEKNK